MYKLFCSTFWGFLSCLNGLYSAKSFISQPKQSRVESSCRSAEKKWIRIWSLFIGSGKRIGFVLLFCSLQTVTARLDSPLVFYARLQCKKQCGRAFVSLRRNFSIGTGRCSRLYENEKPMNVTGGPYKMTVQWRHCTNRRKKRTRCSVRDLLLC